MTRSDDIRGTGGSDSNRNGNSRSGGNRIRSGNSGNSHDTASGSAGKTGARSQTSASSKTRSTNSSSSRVSKPSTSNSRATKSRDASAQPGTQRQSQSSAQSTSQRGTQLGANAGTRNAGTSRRTPSAAADSQANSRDRRQTGGSSTAKSAGSRQNSANVNRAGNAQSRQSQANSSNPSQRGANLVGARQLRGSGQTKTPIEAQARRVSRPTANSRDAERRLQLEREARRRERALKRNRGPLGYQMSRKRVGGFSMACIALLCGLLVRLGYVQLVDNEPLAEAARKLRTTTVELVAERGAITDRNGVAIAESVTRYKVFADQLLLESWKTSVEEDGEKVEKGGPAYAASLLAPILNLDESELTTKLTKAADATKYDQYVTIAKEVAPETWEAIRDLGISGIFPETVNKRIYPSGDTAKNIIGSVGTDGGQSGLEYNLDSVLSGEKGYMTYEQSKNGYMLPYNAVEEKPATQGLTVQSTLDMDIQWHAEKALDAQLKKTGGSAGSVIVQDIHTCEILALADRSTTSDDNTAVTGRIGAVQDIFEPGSTAKVVTMAAALETGVATPLTKFKVPYMYETSNGQVFKDSHDHATQKLTLTGILAESSNTGTVQVGESIPKQVRYDYLYKFGFGQKTGIELGGETRGILHAAEDWDGRTQYGVLFGQGMAANALQATNVFATVANDGQQCQPHLVAGNTDSDGVFTESEKSDTKQIISKKTADKVLKMMESVVVEGSGAAGKIDGYRVAGKTGTAQATGADGKLSSYVSSFIGVAPVDDPELAVSVIIRDPQTSIWGGEVSAPVFADVMAYSLQQLRVEPSTKKPDLFAIEWE